MTIILSSHGYSPSLETSIPDSAVNIGCNLIIHRRDRPTLGGGLLAYVHQAIPTIRLHNLEEDNKEVIWLVLKPPRTPRPFSCILVVGVYNPPGQTAEAEKEMIRYLSLFFAWTLFCVTTFLLV